MSSKRECPHCKNSFIISSKQKGDYINCHFCKNKIFIKSFLIKPDDDKKAAGSLKENIDNYPKKKTRRL